MKLEELKSMPIVRMHLTKIEGNLTPKKIRDIYMSFDKKTVVVAYYNEDSSLVVINRDLSDALDYVRAEMADKANQGKREGGYTTWYVDNYVIKNGDNIKKDLNLVGAAIEAYAMADDPGADNVEHAVVQIEMDDTICFVLTDNSLDEEIPQSDFDQLWQAATKKDNDAEMYEGLPIIIAKNKESLEQKLADMSERPAKYVLKPTDITVNFDECKGLTGVIISESLTELIKYKNNPFMDCSELEFITTAGKNSPVYDTRENCNAIIETEKNELITGCKNSVIPNSVTTIGRYAFLGCTGLTNIIIPGSVTKIDISAFVGCTGLTSIVIPDSVMEIGSSAFKGCTGLTSITIPTTISVIESDTFKGCTGLTSFTFHESVTTIGCNAFSDCTGLTSITIPESVTELGAWGGEVFANCTGLKSVVIQAKLKKIEEGMFRGCTSLEAVTLPAGIGSISKNAFEGCTALKTINVPAKKADYYKKRLLENLHSLIVELPAEKKK